MFDVEKIIDDEKAKVIAEIKNKRPLTSREQQFINILSEPEQQNRLKQNVKVGALRIGGPLVLEALGNKGLGVARVMSAKKSFIIGSFPILKLTNDNRAHLSDPTVEVWLPIAHDIAITPFFTKGKEKLVSIDDRNIRKLNEAITRQSTIIAGRSEKLIRSLISQR